MSGEHHHVWHLDFSGNVLMWRCHECGAAYEAQSSEPRPQVMVDAMRAEGLG